MSAFSTRKMSIVERSKKQNRYKWRVALYGGWAEMMGKERDEKGEKVKGRNEWSVPSFRTCMVTPWFGEFALEQCGLHKYKNSAKPTQRGDTNSTRPAK